MKIELKDIILEILFGTKETSEGYITENYPTIYNAWRKYNQNNTPKPPIGHKEFLELVVSNTEQEETVTKPSQYFTKIVTVDKYSDTYKEYKQIAQREQELKEQKDKVYRKLIEETSPILSQFSTPSLKVDIYKDVFLDFRIFVQELEQKLREDKD